MSSANRSLCIALMHADQEDDVIELLKGAGYWNDSSVWRPYGDNEYNYSTVGNQASRPEAALVEKLVNSVDAKLLLACLKEGIEPEGTEAPDSLEEAVSRFYSPFDNAPTASAGRLREWTPSQRTEVARGITLATTGNKPSEGSGYPCFTISDDGEGQTPLALPETILSLNKKNKQHIRFVQGRFNMGGTGALRFCGRRNLQLVLSRRCPELVRVSSRDPLDNEWSFTIVRREDPIGAMRNSVYTYLAPERLPGEDKGGVLTFSSPTMPIFPSASKPYARDSGWGTLIKLYEYAVPSARTHMFMKRGMQERLDLLLPEIGLPARLHECRQYRGKARSFETTLTGLTVRLDDNRAENLEDGFPVTCPLSASGQKMVAIIYAFKKERAQTYKRNEGIIFTFHGQTHGHMTKDFFRRRKVGMSYLADDILVVVDCSDFDGRAREDLMMNSRDRLSRGTFYSSIERALEDLLKNHSGLRALRERRRREDIADRLDNSKPLAEVLDRILKRSPSLEALFLKGTRLASPFRTKSVAEEQKEFHGRRFPTYFKIKNVDYGQIPKRNCHINMRLRMTFETDAVNDYFRRNRDPGQFGITLESQDTDPLVTDYVLNLHNGIATLSAELPDSAKVGDRFKFTVEVSDSTRVDPFQNQFEVVVLEEGAKTKGGKGSSSGSPGEKKGKERETELRVQLPNVVDITKDQWAQHGFTAESALKIRSLGTDEDNQDRESFDFFVNVDNIHLKAHLKSSSGTGELATARFKYALVLLGLGMIHEIRQTESEDGDKYDEAGSELSLEDSVTLFSKAAAPVILPMIDSLGDLDIDGVMETSSSGEPAD